MNVKMCRYIKIQAYIFKSKEEKWNLYFDIAVTAVAIESYEMLEEGCD